MIAKHVIKQRPSIDNGTIDKLSGNGNFKEAIAFLKATDGNLSIEDILPCFPDFVLIDDFKDAICETVESYNERIRELKEHMEEDTTRADQIRKQHANLRRRSVLVERDMKCARCNLPILTSSTSEVRLRYPSQCELLKFDRLPWPCEGPHLNSLCVLIADLLPFTIICLSTRYRLPSQLLALGM